MRMPGNIQTPALMLIAWLAFAVDAHAAIDNSGVFDSVLTLYQSAASRWAGVIIAAASRLFWMLTTISMVWTFGMLALRKADIGDFFAELVRFTIFTGFFWWALTNGPNFASSIYTSLRQLAGTATGLGNTLSPSGIVDVGFAIFDTVMDQSTIWSPVDSMAGILIALTILVILALVGVNMLLLLTSGWVLAYGGVFFLGFGGSRWTSDMAVNYYKVVLGVAAQLFAMVLIVGIGKTFLDDYYSRMSAGVSIKEMGVLLIVVIILLALTNKIPSLIAGIITGASINGAGIGQFGAGAALGAAGMAAAATATGGAVLAAGAASAAGGASAVMAAFSKASDNVAAGTDVISAISGASNNSSNNSSNSVTPFSQAAGFGGGTTTATGQGGSRGQAQTNDKAGSSRTGTDSSNNKAAKAEPKTSGAGQGTTTSSSGPRSTLGTAARITADAGANLAKGSATVAKAKADSIREAAAERIANTTGGKIAAAIRAGNEKDLEGSESEAIPTFGGNNLSAAVDPHSEVESFAKRERDT